MDFEAVVHLVLPVVTGQGARGEWKKQEVVFELPGEYSRKVCVGFWNERANDAGALRVGERVAVSVNIESREHNERWFTEVRGWKMSRIDGQAQAQGGGYQQQGGYNQPQGGGYQQQGGYNQPQGGGYQQQGGYNQPQGGGYQQQGGYNQPQGGGYQQQGGYNQSQPEPAQPSSNPADDLPF